MFSTVPLKNGPEFRDVARNVRAPLTHDTRARARGVIARKRNSLESRSLGGVRLTERSRGRAGLRARAYMLTRHRKLH